MVFAAVWLGIFLAMVVGMYGLILAVRLLWLLILWTIYALVGIAKVIVWLFSKEPEEILVRQCEPNTDDLAGFPRTVTLSRREYTTRWS